MRPSARARLVRPFLSARFLRFAAVGLSGVGVNLGTLALLRQLRVHTNLASALAIEISILSNFAVNHGWTFRDRRHAGTSLVRQALRFHLVCLGGGMIQFVVFVAMNVVWLLLLGTPGEVAAYGADATSVVERWLWHPFVEPPAVGALVYLSQSIGIGAATVWNYLVNFYWTWAPPAPSGDDAASMRPRRPASPA